MKLRQAFAQMALGIIMAWSMYDRRRLTILQDFQVGNWLLSQDEIVLLID